MQQSDFEIRCSAYQRDLLRSMLVPLGLFCAIACILFAIVVTVGANWPPNNKIVVAIAIFVMAPFIVHRLRRNAVGLSLSHNLICPSCKAPLGLRYATVKRTGQCGVCKAQIVQGA
jgi:hypothetical protein